MVADVSAFYLIRVGERTFVRQGMPAKVATTVMHGMKASEPNNDVRDADERRLQADIEALFRTLMPDIAAMLAKGQMPTDKELADALVAVLRPVLVDTAINEFERQAATIGVQFDPALINQRMVEWAQSYTYRLVSDLNKNTLETLRAAMTQYASTPGMTRGELEALLSPAFGPARAESIAVTEVTRAYSTAQHAYQVELNEHYGITMERVWQTLKDEKVCPLCGPLDGKPESEWGDIEEPPAHPRCRCSVTLRSVRD